MTFAEVRRSRRHSSTAAISIVLLISTTFACILFLGPPASVKTAASSSRSSNDYPAAASPAKNPNSTNILFVISSSSRMLHARAEYLASWWRPESMQGFVWVEEIVEKWPPHPGLSVPAQMKSEPLPELLQDRGNPGHVRMARAIGETVRLLGEAGQRSVDWLVFGDDDTVFFPDNLAGVLATYDSSEMVYVGGLSESNGQRLILRSMGFGGAGIALSLPLAVAMEKMQDGCLSRYATDVYGADGRIHACAAELGVQLTTHQGFHQMDLIGDAFGYLVAHPIAAAVSLHHIDAMDPIFMGLSRAESMRHLFQAVAVDPASIFQQSICYVASEDLNATIGVAWGYAAQVLLGPPQKPRDMEVPWLTFRRWEWRSDFAFPTRFVPDGLCSRPLRFFMTQVSKEYSLYDRPDTEGCGNLTRIRVFKTPLPVPGWYKAPRRQCCRIRSRSPAAMDLDVGDCEPGEIITWTS